MFVRCFEISISVIVNKHIQSIGIIRTFCLLGGLIKIFSAWGDKKLLVCCLLGVDQADTMNVVECHVKLACWFRDY